MNRAGAIAILWGIMLCIHCYPLSAKAQTDTICKRVTEIPRLECEALVALYQSTHGDGWKNNQGWLISNTPCEWYGVYCNKPNHVTAISLEGNDLKGELPHELGNLTYLGHFSLAWNQLTGTIPPEFGKLINV